MYSEYSDDEDAFNQLPPGFNNFMPHGNPNRGFSETYKCYSVVMMQGNERENINYGGKIFLPQSALEKLALLHIQYPMLFSLHSKVDGMDRTTHAGVLEFIAEEGRVYLPHWMMQTLMLEPGSLIEIKNAKLPLGNFVRIQPQTVDFLDISDPKAVLEKALRNFSTLTKGDIIQINYNSTTYEILVMDVKPLDNTFGISIVETDLEVDFAPPLGYVEPERVPGRSGATAAKGPTMASQIGIENGSIPYATQNKFVTFGGNGTRLNEKKKGKEREQLTPPPSLSPSQQSLPSSSHESAKLSMMAPPLNLPFGKLFFGYPVKPVKPKDGAETPEDMLGFQGQGHTLRKQKAGDLDTEASI